MQTRRGPFLDSTSIRSTFEVVGNQDLTDDDDDTLNEVVMAVDLLSRGTVGCCYYVARDERMYFMEDIQFGDVEIIENRKCGVL